MSGDLGGETPGRLLQRAQAALSAPGAPPQALQGAVADLRRCRALAGAAGVFSPNEELDDVATRDLPLLALPALLAEALPQLEPGPTPQRLAHLEAALRELHLFWAACEQYRLLDPPTAAAVRGHGQGPQGAATTREQRVQRYRLEQALQARLRGGARPARTQAGAEVLDEGESDGEEQRDLALARLRLAALRCADAAPVLEQALHANVSSVQEVALLRHRQALEAEGEGGGARQRPRAAPDAQAGAHTEEMLAQLRQAADALTRSDRQRARQEVFRPSHALPTMTLGEFAERELRGVQQREERAQQAEAARRAAQEADREGDEELARQRAWDDWKDDHPAGSGNSRLKPTT